MSQIPRAEWGGHTVTDVMRHDLPALSISPDADALDAMSKMQQNGVSCLLVTKAGQLIGMIGLSDVLRFLSLKLELDRGDDNSAESGEAHRGLPHSELTSER